MNTSLANVTSFFYDDPSTFFDWDSWSEVYKCLLAANAAFWIISTVNHVIDTRILVHWDEYKVQGEKAKLTPADRWEIFRVACINMWGWGFVIAEGVKWACATFGNPRTLQESDPWIWYRELPYFVAHVFIVDFWFYWTHRLLHAKALYGPFHKMHHKFTAPCSMAAVYAHPLEYIVGNVGGVALGPFITNCHPYSAYFWYWFALQSTCFSHSGYRCLNAHNHDAHHEFFNYNFGNALSDVVFGTSLPPELKKKLAEREKLAQMLEKKKA